MWEAQWKRNKTGPNSPSQKEESFSICALVRYFFSSSFQKIFEAMPSSPPQPPISPGDPEWESRFEWAARNGEPLALPHVHGQDQRGGNSLGADERQLVSADK